MSTEAATPWVGDEVLHNSVRAIVTDVRDGILWLRAPGRDEWPVADPRQLTVTRTRAERIGSQDA